MRIYESLGVDTKVETLVDNAEASLNEVFSRIDKTEQINQLRVLKAFQDENVAARHFASTTGYGYDDVGRDTLDRVFAKSLFAEDALVRPHFANGTHALFIALAGILMPNTTMLSIAGKPYDTLEEAIGISGEAYGSLAQLGVNYRQIDLMEDGSLDMNAILDALKDDTIKVVYVQRSRGYAWRKSLTVDTIGEMCKAVKKVRDDVYIVVDNCYGEFTEDKEPTCVGADVIAGSLIKNPGGGIAPTGGYIAGTSECIAMIENRLTVPGMGREVGSYAASYAPFYQGLFLAPHVTAQSIKSAALFAAVFECVGMETLPSKDEIRSDIIQSVRFKSPEALIAFCQSIQRAAPVDSFAVPMPWDMPGYKHQVIMAAGAFVQGSSIELSADAPIKEPYIAYVQGALTYAHGRIGVMLALDTLVKEKIVSL